MKYVIKGKGGQGVLFLSKVLANALLLSGIDKFSFLKEFDEGQRNGEIKTTFFLPLFKLKNKKRIVQKDNMLELREIVDELKIDKDYIKKSLKMIKPEFFKKNWEIFYEKKTN